MGPQRSKGLFGRLTATDKENPCKWWSGSAARAPRCISRRPFPSSDVPAEMARFIEWFPTTHGADRKPKPLPAAKTARQGLGASVFLSVSILFEDGNGRIGPAPVAEKKQALAPKSLAI